VEHQKRRFGLLQRQPAELDFGRAADEPAPPARCQQVTERADGPDLGHSGRIGADVRDD